MIELIGLLEHLDIKPHKTLANHHSGSIRRHSAGNSEDFLRFKHYANGDSLNRIDWRRYAKDKGILTKVFGDEINFDITIAIDTSASMACFEKRKVRYQQRLAEAIAYNALYHGRQVTLIDMGLENHQTMGGECHQGIAKVSKWLETRDCIQSSPRLTPSYYEQFKSTFFICLTDGWHPDLKSLIKEQMTMASDLILIQLLTPEELSPSLSGHLELVDSETGDHLKMKITPEILDRYHHSLKHHTENLRQDCSQFGFRFFQIDVSEPIKPLLISLGR